MRTIEKIFRRESLLQGVLLLAAVILTAQFWLTTRGMSGLCTSKGCKIAGNLLNFPEYHLILAGAAFFWILWLLVFFACRYKKQVLWQLIITILFAALAFDGVLLSYQFLKVGVMCWLCLGVGGALFAALVSLVWVRKSLFVLLLGVCIWCGAFMGEAVLYSNLQSPGLSQTDFMTRPAENKESAGDFYLFFSLNCHHCSQVMANIILNKAWEVNWHLCSVDRSNLNLKVLANIVQNKEAKDLPFLHILKAKSSQKIPDVPVPSKLEEQVENASTFFRNSAYKSVPLLIAREGMGKDVYLTGSQSIAKYLYEKGLIKKWYSMKEIQNILQEKK
ncbi:MAG: hypothetical protein ACOCZ2_04775 [Thermodesulfobacteriota bacterium]